MKVLIVEKHPGIVDMLSWHFCLGGHEVLRGWSGLDWMIQAACHKPDVILVDLSTLDWENREIIVNNLEKMWMACFGCRPPLVIMTTARARDWYVLGYRLIEKPFHVNYLLGVIKSMKVMEVL